MWRLRTEVCNADVHQHQCDVNQNQQHRENTEKHVFDDRLHVEPGFSENTPFKGKFSLKIIFF